MPHLTVPSRLLLLNGVVIQMISKPACCCQAGNFTGVGVRFLLFDSRATQGALDDREHLPTPCANSTRSGVSSKANLDHPRGYQ